MPYESTSSAESSALQQPTNYKRHDSLSNEAWSLMGAGMAGGKAGNEKNGSETVSKELANGAKGVGAAAGDSISNGDKRAPIHFVQKPEWLDNPKDKVDGNVVTHHNNELEKKHHGHKKDNDMCIDLNITIDGFPPNNISKIEPTGPNFQPAGPGDMKTMPLYVPKYPRPTGGERVPDREDKITPFYGSSVDKSDNKN